MGSDYISVTNRSKEKVWVFVSKYTKGDGSDAWYELEPGKSEQWLRAGGNGGKGWELVAFKNHNDSWRAGEYVHVGYHVSFHNWDQVVIDG